MKSELKLAFFPAKRNSFPISNFFSQGQKMNKIVKVIVAAAAAIAAIAEVVSVVKDKNES